MGSLQHLYDQNFYYRVSGDGFESNFSNLNWTVPTVLASRFSIQGGVSNQFDVEMTYTLTGGSNSSVVGEGVSITNTSQSALNLHIFKYVDLDLNGSICCDTATRTNANTFQQVDGNVFSEMVLTNAPTAWQVGGFGSYFNLNDALITTLTNSGSGYSGDATYAMEWIFNIGAGQTQTFGSTTYLEISQVPVPAAAWLMGSALVGLTGIARHRNST